MFSLDVVDTDAFLEMPPSTQALYFHLGMRADDDGFVSSPRKIIALTNCGNDDMKLLVAKGYVIPFESGVCVISEWKINNYLRSDRYKQTRYKQELAAMKQADGRYQLAENGTPLVYQPGDNRYTQDRLDKDIENKADKPPRAVFAPPSLEEVMEYCEERHNGIDAQRFHDFYSANGWVQGRGKPVKDWKACVRTWEAKGNAHNTAPQTSNTDAIKARRERERAATVTSDDLVEYPAGSGLYRLRSAVEGVDNGRI